MHARPTRPHAAAPDDPPPASEPPARDPGMHRRGPFRPERLVTARARRGGRLAVLAFRLADVVGITVMSSVVVAVDADRAVLELPLSRVLPVLAAALVTARLLRTALLYRFGRRERLAGHVARLVGTVAVGAVAGMLCAVLADDGAEAADALVRWAIPVAAVLVALHLLWWSMVRGWRSAGRLTPNVVIVGATRHAEQIVREALDRRTLNVLGVFDDRLARAPRDIAGVPVLGDTAALVHHRITPYVDLIVIAVDPAAEDRVRNLVTRLAALPNEITLLIDDEGDRRSTALRRLADGRLTSLDIGADPDRRAFAKRLQDVALALLGLVALAPVIALVALAVRLDSRGPVFFRQRRHGFNNEEIVVWKFRTMRQEATDHRSERQVTAGDNRVTRVGRVLRSTSLDELPQLLNVVAGSMSMVGPRPHAIGMRTGDEESAALVADYARRHRIKPGMTGWAAVKGSRGPLHTAEAVRRRVALDVEYIERQSFWLDLWIIAMTVPSLLGDRATVR